MGFGLDLEKYSRTADEVRAELPRLLKRREELLGELTRVNRLIDAFQNFSNALLPETQQMAPTEPPAPPPALGDKQQHADAASRIDQVLEGGKKLTHSEILTAIEESFATRYGKSTVYNILGAGQKSGKYLNENGKWWLAK